MTFSYPGWRNGFDPALWRRAWLKTSKAPTILVVDDDAIVAEMYRLALVRGGYDVVVAKDGPTALRMAETSDPALIFLDIRMPHMDGMEVLQRLAADVVLRLIPVVMLSNYDDHNFINRSLRLGAKQYIVKVSIQPAELAAVASRWIRPAE
jgi:CheY-like chemotaxis protein